MNVHNRTILCPIQPQYLFAKTEYVYGIQKKSI